MVIFVSCRCDGCGSGGAYFETYMNQPGRTKDSTQCVFIVAGGTHMGYYKTLKHALGIDVVGPNAFMDTIPNMYSIVKLMLDKISEAAKQEMKQKRRRARVMETCSNCCRWYVANTWLA